MNLMATPKERLIIIAIIIKVPNEQFFVQDNKVEPLL